MFTSSGRRTGEGTPGTSGGPEADVQIEILPKGHVEAADASADRRGEGTFDPDEVAAEGLLGFPREPRTRLGERALAGEHGKPFDPALATVGLRNRGVEDTARGAPYIGPRSVTFDEGDDGRIRNGEPGVCSSDFFSHMTFLQ